MIVRGTLEKWMNYFADGAFCKSPPSVENKKVENAFDSLDCTTPTSPILSTASSPGTEVNIA